MSEERRGEARGAHIRGASSSQSAHPALPTARGGRWQTRLPTAFAISHVGGRLWLPQTCAGSENCSVRMAVGRCSLSVRNMSGSGCGSEMLVSGQNFTLRQLGVCEPANRRGLAFCAEMGLPHRGYSISAGSDADTENEAVMSPEHAMRLWGRGVKSGRSSCLSSRSNSALTLTDTEHENKSDSESVAVLVVLSRVPCTREGAGRAVAWELVLVAVLARTDRLQNERGEPPSLVASVPWVVLGRLSCLQSCEKTPNWISTISFTGFVHASFSGEELGIRYPQSRRHGLVTARMWSHAWRVSVLACAARSRELVSPSEGSHLPLPPFLYDCGDPCKETVSLFYLRTSSCLVPGVEEAEADERAVSLWDGGSSCCSCARQRAMSLGLRDVLPLAVFILQVTPSAAVSLAVRSLSLSECGPQRAVTLASSFRDMELSIKRQATVEASCPDLPLVASFPSPIAWVIPSLGYLMPDQVAGGP
ncbi:Teneurin-3 [Galemys pyrenaicus]|uniref:Teneurin-3 n=1 Tax=Galemys pyrenaicus TaxID=202257 RepID=A0A8J5ZVS5_GALPY|nr:Teneurin-3 [Galemys pyrenaicus]